MPTSRCYNCGIPGHQTQDCPRHGPRYPEPGKSFKDYAAKYQEIMDLVAADILREHMGHSEDDDIVLTPQSGGRRLGAQEEIFRANPCPSCGSPVPETCYSKTGKPVKSHAARRELTNPTKVNQ